MIERKSILARLLSNENINVEHGSYETAFFDVKSRVLGLPLWTDDKVYDLFIGHEISHSLNTPPEEWIESLKKKLFPQSVLNVVEDIRIEKLIQIKYPGLVHSFKVGYDHLNEKDFFNLNGVNHLDEYSYNFIDRLNIKAKLGDRLNVLFNETEQEYVDMAFAVETWDDVINVTHKIYEFMKQNLNEIKNKTVNNDSHQKMTENSSDKNEDNNTNTEYSSEVNNSSDDEMNDSSVTKESSSEEKETIKESSSEEKETNQQGGGEGSSEQKDYQEKALSLESETDKALEESKKKILERDGQGNIISICQGMKDEQIKNILIDYKKLSQSRKSFGINIMKDETKKFINSNKNIVSNMVKEFEMRKAASQLARAKVSKTGSLNVNKLYEYKYNDDIFLRTTNIGEAKNHGMLMLVDYSGSMYNTLKSVIKQTLVLVMFCKKVGIPFQVYGFSSSNNYTKTDFINYIRLDDCCVFELISSSMNKKDYEEAFDVLVSQSYIKDEYDYRFYSCGYERLSSTPLIQSMYVMRKIAIDFRKKFNIQKLSFVTLTDGFPDYTYMIDNSYALATFKKIKFGNKYIVNSPNLLQNMIKSLKEDKIIDNSINYNLVTKSNMRGLYSINRSEINKNKFQTVKNLYGYDIVIFIKQENSVLDLDDDELEVSSDMKKGQIIKEFKKFSSSKRNNRIIATKFAETIA